MDSIDPIFAHVVSIVAGALVTSIWEGTLLAAVIALCMRFLPGITAAARSRIWGLVFVVAVLLPLGGLIHAGAVSRPAAPFLVRVSFAWTLALVGVWATLSIYRAAQLLRSAFSLHKIATRAYALPVGEDFAQLLELRLRWGSPRKAQLCLSDDVSAPGVAGFFSPRILLPAPLLESMSREDIRQIVLHEMEHLRRKDDWTNLMQKAGLMLFPLNPVLFWVERRLCREREMACDDGVLRATGAGRAYATCLTNLAEQALVHRSISLLVGAWQRQSELSRRVHRILRVPERQVRPIVGALSLGLAFVGTVGLGAALTRAPQIIAFGGDQQVRTTAASGTSDTIPAAATHVWPGPQPTLVKATTPERRPEKVLAKSKHVVPTRTARAKMPPPSRGTDSWVVLTDWHFTYAAVPVQDGWLVVQL
jgi:beta-lactamase regulating signal transducer with metallopeptidase domain